LYRTAHNWVSDYYRRRPAPALALDNLQIADPAPEPSQAAQAEERREELRRALSSLTPDQRQVLVLKYLEDWSNAEIAQALEKPVGAVKALRNRGIQALRRYLLKSDSESENI
jgi:RNA polymerase sigma-70 factor (ECF subfamily)